MLSNASDFFDVTLVWSDYKDGGANEIKTSRKRGSSQVIFMLVRKCWQNNYKRRYHTGQASVFHQLFVKDDLSKPALAFTWWAPHGPKMNDEKEDDTSANIGKRRVQVGEQPGGQGGSLLSFRGWQGVREEGGKQLQHEGWSRRRYCDCEWISLRSLSHSNNFYDVTLVPEDGKVEKAHKIVLSIRSTFYKMTTRGGLGWIIR